MRNTISRKREALLWIMIFGAFCITGTMDHEDEVLQQTVNCSSATFAHDNPNHCTGE